MIKVLASNECCVVCGAVDCGGSYLMPIQAVCTAPASPGAMLRLNTTDGVVKIFCSSGDSPWGVFGPHSHISCFPDSSMQIACIDNPGKNWCEGSIEAQRP